MGELHCHGPARVGQRKTERDGIEEEVQCYREKMRKVLSKRLAVKRLGERLEWGQTDRWMER